MSNTVSYTSDEGVAIITLDRPEKLNALNTALVADLEQALIRFRDSSDRAAVLTGAGERAFSAGADLDDNPMDLFRAVPHVGFELDKPLVAAVHGHVIGGGYVLAQHCDLIVAADTTRFLYPEAMIGFTGGISAGLAARVPLKHAMEFLLLGEPMSGERAYEIGMVNRCVPYGEHLELATAWARRLADSAPLVVQRLRQDCEDSVLRSPSERAARTRYNLSTVNDSKDYAEALSARAEKRQPNWVGA
ncbi:enoyl-CoA hydratase/isomerase family protein [Aeromicrobium sp. YIM 150415]|uniref:enoyl-CoA hydratase/isomerase family protein n=1 Tax=Aeromicrobium sp. YIM 150415 TaxID=2803912 RepID=UPI001964C0A4|nr:enoyl-CoA hydratase-related protein [Aeromicrobium sp. YIM 150415]MBM9463044.1 enoyl-CoA hydratase/isomerase family protein [Aeromicrobium sp. YIM 150415]